MKEGIEGNTLVLTKLTRADGGAYLCIAQNGVPSPVSKRIMVHVHCKSSQIKHLIECKISTLFLISSSKSARLTEPCQHNRWYWGHAGVQSKDHQSNVKSNVNIKHHVLC